jgi:FlaA1/EpsC-like NDP-sugar epimerase
MMKPAAQGEPREGRRRGIRAWAEPFLNRETRLLRFGMVLVLYSLALSASLYLAFLFRFDFEIPSQQYETMWQVGVWLVVGKIVLLYLSGQFSGLLSYFSVPDLRRLVGALALGSLLPLVAWYFTDGAVGPPRGVILADFVFSVGIISAIRLGLRVVRERYWVVSVRRVQPDRKITRVGIIGAGQEASTLARDFAVRGGLGLRPVLFLDDNPAKWGSMIHNIPILGPPERLAEPSIQRQVDKVVIAKPTVTGRRLREIVKLLQETRTPFETIPSMDQLASGDVKATLLRPVEIQDLLGRDPVRLEMENIRTALAGKVVMVTGAGGSIGSELCRQIALFEPRQLLMVEQSEGQLFSIEQEMIERRASSIAVPLMADVLELPRMHDIFERHQPQVVFHAAAHKHVPMMERNPAEAIKNNTLATAGLASLAVEFAIERFVLISTDKAINPTSVMGASKRLAEMYLQSLAARQNSGTQFMAVRFGNVLGSSGSVVPIFKKQIALGGPVRVTHPEMKRYFMTIPEAVSLVLQCGVLGTGGEIFVLDMGEPVKIVDLARQMIELSGLRPQEDIEIEFSGLRPGEKLFEEISHHLENMTSTAHPKIMRLMCEPEPLEELEPRLQGLYSRLFDLEPDELRRELKLLIPEYAHNGNTTGGASVPVGAQGS